jgi:hypothetical protein
MICSPRIVRDFDNCNSTFSQYYKATNACAAAEEEEAVTLFTLRETGFIVIYVWACSVPFFMILWCYFNQRFSPVPGSNVPLLMEASSSKAGGEYATTTTWTVQ